MSNFVNPILDAITLELKARPEFQLSSYELESVATSLMMAVCTALAKDFENRNITLVQKTSGN